MDVFALLFIVSFLVLIFTLVVMHIRKCMNKGKGEDGKCYLFLDDYNNTDKLEISHKLYNMILEEFGNKEEDWL